MQNSWEKSEEGGTRGVCTSPASLYQPCRHEERLLSLADVRTRGPLSSDQYAPLEKRDPGGGVEQITKKKKLGEKDSTPPQLCS
jgi:hypothetical protein